MAAFRLVPESRNEAQVRHFDVAGATTVTSGLIVLVYAIVKSTDWGWGSASTLGLIALGAALLGAFVAIERRSHAPLVRLDLFKLRSLATANGVMLLVISGMISMFFFCTLYLQKVLGYSALETGVAFLPVSFGIVIGSVLAQQLIGRLGTKRCSRSARRWRRSGSRCSPRRPRSTGPTSALLAAFTPLAIGMGLTFVPLTLVATTNVSKEDAGPRLRRVQHLPAGGRRARARGALHVRQRPDGERARGRRAAERGARGRVPARVRDRGRARGRRAVVATALLRRRDVARIDAGDVDLAAAAA